MNKYEELHNEAYEQDIIVKEVCLKSNSDGLYFDSKIAINKNRLSNINEKTCVLAEELAHHYLTCGNILDTSIISNSKQEYKARLYAYNKLIGLNGLINAYKNGCRSRHEISDYLNITDSFLDEAINCYTSKYESYVEIDNYIIIFNPYFAILEQKEDT